MIKKTGNKIRDMDILKNHISYFILFNQIVITPPFTCKT
jgi:hypothetical protein